MDNHEDQYYRKKTIQRKLSLDTKYTLINIHRGSLEEYATVCQNCDKLISNIALIEDEAGQKYEVGLDCGDTLQFHDFTGYEFEKKQFRTVLRFIGNCRKVNANLYARSIFAIVQYRDKHNKKHSQEIRLDLLEKFAKDFYDSKFKEVLNAI